MLKFVIDLFKSKKTYDFYLAGGMRGYKNQNKPMFMLVAKLLRQNGYTIWNPVESEATLSTATFADCMVLDLTTIIESCKGIILLPGWRKSLGANIEATVSFAIGNKSYEVMLDKDEMTIELLDIDLSKYRLPYEEDDTNCFDPHLCELDSFQKKSNIE